MATYLTAKRDAFKGQYLQGRGQVVEYEQVDACRTVLCYKGVGVGRRSGGRGVAMVRPTAQIFTKY